MSCCVRVGSGVQTDATTPNTVGPAVHRREKDTDHKTSMRVRGPNHVETAMHYGSNIVGLRFGDHTTKEILRVVS